MDQSSSCRDPSPSPLSSDRPLQDRPLHPVPPPKPAKSPSLPPCNSLTVNSTSPSTSSSSKKAKKKSKKHKEKDRTKEKRVESSSGLPSADEHKDESQKSKKRRANKETNRGIISENLQRNQDSPDKDKLVLSTEFPSTNEEPDYITKYKPVVSMNQWQSYREDFNAEYDEYRQLHAHVESITHHFIQLDTRCRKLTPGTKEHRKMQEEVVREYKKIKQHTNYHEEKQRCKYLHNKLAHIKQLISDFDQRRAQPWYTLFSSH